MRNYSNGIWWFRLKPDLNTTRVMPSGTRITQTENGVLITGVGYVRWIKNDWHE
jgi:hypothetical protein